MFADGRNAGGVLPALTREFRSIEWRTELESGITSASLIVGP
jgi:hypothetical protein